MTTSPRITNIYALLQLKPQATVAEIQTTIEQERTRNQLNPAILERAESWLLNPQIRAKYDSQLKLQSPELFEATDFSNMKLVPETTSPTEKSPATRLGILEEETYDGRGDVRLEPDIMLEKDTYAIENARYNRITKSIIYGGIALFIIGLVLLFSWPLLERTILAPSEQDMIEFRQQWASQGWQLDEQRQQVYWQSNEPFDIPMAIIFENHKPMAVLEILACDANPQGLCNIDIDVDNGKFVYQGSSILGLRDNLPMVPRHQQENLIEALENAQTVQVRLWGDGEAVDVVFER